jgi:4-hydroxy-tetrahydrodipicolinate synthase
LFTGSIVALVTPFKDGRIDEAKLRELVRWHALQGTAALVPVGTTGESPTLSEDEAKRVIEICVAEARLGGTLKVIAGTGSYSTSKSVESTRWAKAQGADAALIVCPYYNKPSQEGIYQHYKAVAEDGGLPVVVYTIPGRSVVNIEAQTIARLAEIKNIVAVKEASGNLIQMSEIVSLVGDRLVLLSGDDPLTLPMFAIGGKGVISVTANVAPRRMADLCEAGLKGDFALAKKIHYALFPLFKALFAETNPIGIKAAMELAGLCSGELRLPLTHMTEGNVLALEKAMRSCGVLA